MPGNATGHLNALCYFFVPLMRTGQNVGAITRFADGREKIICLSPEYAEAEASRNRFVK